MFSARWWWWWWCHGPGHVSEPTTTMSSLTGHTCVTVSAQQAVFSQIHQMYQSYTSITLKSKQKQNTSISLIKPLFLRRNTCFLVLDSPSIFAPM